MKVQFKSWLKTEFRRFIDLKRSMGAKYIWQEQRLQDFDSYLHHHKSKPPLVRKVMLEYLETLDRLSLRAKDNVVSVVWQAVEYAQRIGSKVVSIPTRPPLAPTRYRVHPPRYVAVEEIQQILLQSQKLQPSNMLRPETYRVLYGLLFTTGLRIGEALNLNICDFEPEPGILTVQNGKFGKSRILPITQSVVKNLSDYISDPRRKVRRDKSKPIFTSKKRNRLGIAAAGSTLKKLSLKANLSYPHPTPHDLRHSFAIRTVLRMYQNGQDFNQALLALSTYLGHASLENTRTYLQANGALLKKAGSRFARIESLLLEVLA